MSALVVTLLLGADAEGLFRDAVARQRAGEKSREAFKAAAAAYEAVRAGGASNAGLYRNLGSAYLLSGDLPRAVLMYRLGLRAEPGDAALTRALGAARERVGAGPFGRPPEERRSWSVPLFAGAAVAWLLTCVLFTRWRMRRGGFPAGAAAALAAALACAAGLVLHPDDDPRPVAVIAADGVAVRKGDGELFPPRYEATLSRGVEADVVYRKGGWLLIELGGGERGWVAARDVVE
ncbi:MAG: hypothetical protein ACRC33_01420 [Gemmataceae bacterium]